VYEHDYSAGTGKVQEEMGKLRIRRAVVGLSKIQIRILVRFFGGRRLSKAKNYDIIHTEQLTSISWGRHT
jgi:hypothetical protein